MLVTDTESFIKKSREVHGDKYNYSLVEYTKSKNYVTIICPFHGAYSQRASNHISGRGCRKCKSEFIGNFCRQPADKLISELNSIHNNRYDYSLITDNRKGKKISIICRIHGAFSQDITMHKSGQGCRKCGLISGARKRRKSIKEFIDLSKDVHGDRFEYDLTGYSGIKSRIKVYCKNHGWFYQTCEMHLTGRGCDKCAREASRPPNYSDGFFDNCVNRSIPATFYYVEIEHIESGKSFHKVGISRKKRWSSRFSGLSKMGFEIKPIKIMESTAYECWELEQLIISELNNSNMLYKCHYFKDTYIGGWTECFWPKEWYNTDICRDKT